MGASDASYGCVFQREDDQGVIGVSLSKQVRFLSQEFHLYVF